MKFLLFIPFTLLSISLFAQSPFRFPKIAQQGAPSEKLVPNNWTLLDQAKGDLNNDGIDDLAMILEFNRSIDETRVYGDNNTDIIKETQRPRILAIFFKEKNGLYRLALQNNDFILRSEEGGKLGDPLQKTAIQDQQLFLRFQGGAEWRWEMGYTFKFENKDWFLTNAINLYYNHQNGDMTERIYNFKERELTTTYGNIYRRDIANHKTSEVLFFNHLRTFKTFKKPWAWEIMPNVYL